MPYVPQRMKTIKINVSLVASLPQLVQLRRQLAAIKGLFFEHSPLLAQSIQCLNLLMHGPKMFENRGSAFLFSVIEFHRIRTTI